MCIVCTQNDHFHARWKGFMLNFIESETVLYMVSNVIFFDATNVN